MSKNFEEEYKALAEGEMPDLWNRIEAGLTPRSAALQIPEEFDSAIPAKDQASENKGRILPFLYRYRGLAAAIICVLVVLPTIWLMRESKGGAFTGQNAASDTAAMEAYENETAAETFTSVTEEAADTAAAGAAAEAAADEADDMAFDTAAAKAADMEAEMDSDGGTAGTGAIADSSAEDALEMEDALAEAQRQESLPSASLAEKMMNMAEQTDSEKQAASQIFSQVQIRIVSLEEMTDRSASADREGFLCCQVELEADLDETHKAGDILSVYVDAENGRTLQAAESLLAEIAYDPGGELEFILLDWEMISAK